MKTIGKFLSFSLAIILSISSFTNPVFAMESTDFSQPVIYETISVNDKEIKVSSELSPEEKSEVVTLFNEIPTLTSEGVITAIDKSLTIFADSERTSAKSQGQSKSVISTSKLELTMIKSDVSTSTKSKYNIQTVAVWKSAPAVKSKDQFAIAWAGDYAVTSYSSNSYWRTSSGQSIAVNSPVSEIVPNAGVAYEYQCGNSDSNFSFDPWYIQINATLSRAKGNGNNPVNVVAKYAHKTISLGSIGVSIAPGVINFSASGAAAYDTASPVSTVIYY